jgi:signal transduction histidine kinase
MCHLVPLRAGGVAGHHPGGVNAAEGAGDTQSIGMSRDRDELEERRLQEEKLEAIGQLANGVARDFNNILATILARAEFALRSLPDGHPARTEIEEIGAAAQRAVALTRQLLAFGRRQMFRPRLIALNAAVTSIHRMLTRMVGADIRIEMKLVAAPGSMLADPAQIEQVLLNLVVNARDAMPLGGKITIDTGNAELDEREAALAGVAPGRYVLLAVSDTGVGMDDAVKSRIFEPFFTTKDAGKGIGLGLSTVFGIVKQAGGGIRVESSPGAGTRFTLYFPRVDEPSSTHAVASSPPAASRGREAILVLEEDNQVRRLVTRLLAGNGYSVLEARSAAAALDEILAASRVDLVLTDRVLPELDGRVRVLSLQKPFTTQELLEAVRRAIDA